MTGNNTSKIALVMVLMVGGSMVIAPVAAHDELNPSKWTTEQDWNNLTDSQTGVSVSSGGSVSIDENTTYASNNITLSDDAHSVGVNITTNDIAADTDITLVNASDGSSVGSVGVFGSTGNRLVASDVTAGDYYIEVAVTDDADGTAESVTIDNINAELQNSDPVLVRGQASDEYRTEVGDNVTLDFSASFDADGDNLTYFIKQNGKLNGTQVDGDTHTLTHDSIGEYRYDVQVEDEHGAMMDAGEQITVTVLEDGSLTTETDTDTGGSGTTGDSTGPLGFGIPLIVYGLVAGVLILVGVASIDE
ncbi:hypothetical protein [Haloarcula sp. CGMCC 1.6347]|uniref:hypothetical protein n=1 Tax=Haloarcula sp. CGMCC 1.6347 TaxID=3111455 RepID=UPI00300E7C1C